MAENDQKSILIDLKINQADAQQIENTLRRLATTANSLSEAFQKIANPATSTSTTQDGKANPATLQQAASATKTGRHGNFSAVIENTKELNKVLTAAVPSLKDFTKEYGDLMKVLNGPLPDGAASVLDAIKAVGGGGGRGGGGFGVASPATAGGSSGKPPTGGRGGPTPPSDDEGEVDNTEAEEQVTKKTRKAMRRIRLRHEVLSSVVDAYKSISDVRYQADTYGSSVAQKTLETEAALSLGTRSMYSDSTSGQFGRAMTINKMGGMGNIQATYGDPIRIAETKRLEREKSIASAKMGLGTGLALAGGAVLFGLATGGAGFLVEGAAALGGGIGIGAGAIGMGAITGGVGLAASGYSDHMSASAELQSGAPRGKSALAVQRAIETSMEKDPMMVPLSQYFGNVGGILSASRRLQRGGLDYINTRETAYQGDIDMNRATELAAGIARQTRASRALGMRSSLFEFERGGYDVGNILSSASLLAERTDDPRIANKLYSKLGGGAGKDFDYLFEEKLATVAKMSRNRFGALSGQGIGNVANLLGGMKSSEMIGLRAQGIQSAEAGFAETLPYMQKLLALGKMDSAKGLSLYQQMGIAQMGPLELMDPSKLQEFGLTPSEGDRSKLMSSALSGMYTPYLDPTSPVGAAIMRAEGEGGFGGDIYKAIKDERMGETVRAELAKMRFAGKGQQSIDTARQELDVVAGISAGAGIGADTVPAARGYDEAAKTFRETQKLQFRGEYAAMGEAATSLASALRTASNEISAITTKYNAARSNHAAIVKPAGGR